MAMIPIVSKLQPILLSYKKEIDSIFLPAPKPSGLRKAGVHVVVQGLGCTIQGVLVQNLALLISFPSPHWFGYQPVFGNIFFSMVESWPMQLN